jgi:hypothetical protein
MKICKLLVVAGLTTVLSVATNAQTPIDSNVSINKLSPNGNTQPIHIADEGEVKNWARVVRMIPPVYPPDELSKGLRVVVDIELLISTAGGVKEVRSIKSEPSNVAFEIATREVLKLWKFGVPKNDQCERYEVAGEVQLTFEVIDGKSKVLLTHERQNLYTALLKSVGINEQANDAATFMSAFRKASAKQKMLNVAAYRQHMKDFFPRQARGAVERADVTVEGRITVESKTGIVVDAQVTYVEGSRDYARYFAQAAEKTMKFAIYQPIADDLPTWKGCTSLRYRFGQ